MKTIDLNEDNAFSFREILDDDWAENIRRQAFHGLIIQDDEGKAAAGMIWELIQEKESALRSQIHWIAVRSTEAGTTLFNAYDRRIGRTQAQSTFASVYIKKNSTEYETLKAAGFAMKLTEGNHVTVRLSELSEMQMLKSKTLSDDVKSLREIDTDAYYDMVAKLSQSGRARLCRDIEQLPKSWFENDISCCYEKDGKITGMMLFHATPSGKLELKLMYASAKEKKQMGVMLAMMIRHMYVNAQMIYSMKTEIIVDRHNESALVLSEKLFPRGFGRPVYVGERKEKPAPIKRELTDIERYLLI